MTKGKLGINYCFYGVLGFVLAIMGQTLLLGLLCGFVAMVEKEEWVIKQTLQAFLLSLAATALYGLVSGFFGFFSGANVLDTLGGLIGGAWGIPAVLNRLVFICVAIFGIIGILKNVKGQDAEIPGILRLSEWALGYVQPKPGYGNPPPSDTYYQNPSSGQYNGQGNVQNPVNNPGNYPPPGNGQ